MSEGPENIEPHVVISILNWMNYNDTINCLRSIKNLNYSNLSILIRDNASANDSCSKIQAAFPDLRIERSQENNGFAAGHFANYLLAKEMNAELFWILNSDLVVDENSLRSLVSAYTKSGLNIYGSVSLNPENPELVDFGGSGYNSNSNKKLTYNSWRALPYKELIQKHPGIYEVESVEGSSMFIPMTIIEKYGFMKLDFFMYAEETDYCYRMRINGIKSYVVTTSLVHHHNEGSSKVNPNLKLIPIYYRRRNALRFSIEHLGMSRWQALSYQNGILNNMKAILKAWIKPKEKMHYFYALGCLHAFLGKKGKTISPEKLLD